MSAPRKVWHVGDSLTVSELQRAADGAAIADNRAQEAIFTPNDSGVQKRICPLGYDTAQAVARLLIVPGTAAGTVKLNPCRIIAGTAPYTIAAAVTNATAMQSPVFANNPGASRIDLVYATLTLTTTTTTRKWKNATSGVVTVEPVSVEEQWVLTVGIAQGDNVGGTPGVLPADTATTYHFSLATVTLPSGYVNTTVITQAIIAQTYERAWISPQRVASIQPMDVLSGTSTPDKPPLLLGNNSRWGSLGVFYGGWRHRMSGQATIFLDGSIDWRNRLVWGQVICYGSGLAEALTTSVTVNNYLATIGGNSVVTNSVPMCIFKGDSYGQLINAYGMNASWILTVDATNGSLSVRQNDATAPIFGVDNYGIFLFASDRFAF